MVNMAGNERGSQAEFFYELRGGGWKGASPPLALVLIREKNEMEGNRNPGHSPISSFAGVWDD